MVHSTFFCLLFKKTEKVKEQDLYLNQTLHHFDLIFFPRMNNKNFTNRVPLRASVLFLYEVSIVVLIDFIAILLTPGIFLIQIINTNMYLIHFRSKNNISMRFLKSWVFEGSNPLQAFIIHHNGVK